MSTSPRLDSSVDGERQSARTIFAHSPKVREAFDTMYATLWSDGVAPMDVKELIRLRNARVTGCGL